MDKCIFSLVLSFLAIVIASITAFSVGFNVTDNNFILGTLSLLVTILIGWQIYSKITVEERVKKIINEQIDLGANTALFVALAQSGMTSFNKGDVTEAIQSLLNALCIWEKGMNSNLANETFDYCVKTLVSCFSDNITFIVGDCRERDAYYKAITKTENQELMNLVTRIQVK